MKRFAPISLTLVFVLYFLVNVAYFSASMENILMLWILIHHASPVPKADIKTSKELTASLFFMAVFGNGKSGTALSALVAISSFGNMLAIVIASSRIIRECGRHDGIFKAF